MSKNETNESKTGNEQAQRGTRAVNGAPLFEFRSRYARFKILLKSPRHNDRGKLIEEGVKVAFENNLFTTSDAKLAAELRALPGFGRDFDQINTQAIQRAMSAAA